MNQMLQDRGNHLRGSPWFCKELLKLSAGKDLRMHWVQQDAYSTALLKDFEEARFIWLALAHVKIKWKGNRENEESGLPAYQVATNSPKQMKPSSPAHACSDMLRAAHVKSCMYLLHVYKENPQNCGCIVTEKNIFHLILRLFIQQFLICSHIIPPLAPPDLSRSHFTALYSHSKTLHTCHLCLFKQQHLESWC